jgi:alpha-L-fucosidase 2
VDLAWADGKLTAALLRSRIGNTCRLRYADRTIELPTTAGGKYEVAGRLTR